MSLASYSSRPRFTRCPTRAEAMALPWRAVLVLQGGGLLLCFAPPSVATPHLLAVLGSGRLLAASLYCGRGPMEGLGQRTCPGVLSVHATMGGAYRHTHIYIS